MIVLDSNVVSALMRLESEPAIAAWLTQQKIDDLWTTSPTVFEIRFGIEAKPQGRRRRVLEEAFQDVLTNLLGRRVVEFDLAAAEAAGRARAVHKRRGVAVSIPDSQIAGIALDRGVPIATRDVDGFGHLGITLVNPWSSGV